MLVAFYFFSAKNVLLLICSYVAGKSYHHYDSIAYPEVASKTTIIKGLPIKEIGLVDNELLIPDHETMQAEALGVYLHGYRTKLCGFDLSKLCDIEYTTRKIVKIYRALNNFAIGAREETHRGGRHFIQSCKELHAVSLV